MLGLRQEMGHAQRRIDRVFVVQTGSCRSNAAITSALARGAIWVRISWVNMLPRLPILPVCDDPAAERIRPAIVLFPERPGR